MNKSLIKFSSILCFVFLLLLNSANALEKTVLLKPFTLAKIVENKSLSEVALDVRQQLLRADFRIVGTYEPYPVTKIFVITSEQLLKTAALTEFGGFGATIRVSVTNTKNGIQVVHNNPTYMSIAYNMKGFLNPTRQKLAKTLGYIKDFGGKGIPANELGDYNYAFGLEGFTGFMDLALHSSHKEAVKQVEAGFRKNIKNMKKVYRIDVPGKDQTVFGVSLMNDEKDEKFLNDKYVMKVIDNHDIRRSAHLPYEIMVTGKRVFMMHPHFRLAINFPDLHMFGKHSFGQLMNLPYVYEEFFIQLAGGTWPPEEHY